MQRVEPRELVGAAASALALPSCWFLAAWLGVVPDVLDGDAGAGLVYAIGRWREGAGPWPAVPLGLLAGVLSPLPTVAAARFALAITVGIGGVGTWWLTAQRPPAERAAAVCLVQLGPWTVVPLLGANLPGLAFVGLLLALCARRLGLVGALFGAPVAAASVLLGAVRRAPWLLAGVLGLGVLATEPVAGPGGALRAPEGASAGPAYGGEGGAWFPMPPEEARSWAQASAGYDGWVHPRAGSADAAPGDQPVEQGAPHGAPLRARLRAGAVELAEGTIVADELRAIGLSGASAPLWGLILWVLVRRGSRRALIGAAVLSALASVGLAVAVRADHPRTPRGADLAALVARLAQGQPGPVMLFPPPEAPYRAGRLSRDRWAAVLVAAGRAPKTAPSLASALAERMEYGLDIAAAEVLWSARASSSPFTAAREGGLRVLVVDGGAVPVHVWNRVDGWVAQRLGPPVRVGDLRVYDVAGAVEGGTVPAN